MHGFIQGSAHCFLTPHWTSKLHPKPGDSMTSYQASARGGLLYVRVNEDGAFFCRNFFAFLAFF